jgi:hypothetical protein
MPAVRSPPTACARAMIWGWTSAVSVQPGQMQLTVTPPFAGSPAAAYSSAATFESPTSPCLAAT